MTKATVSVVFDNRERERGPVGYEHLDEITVTRQLVIGGRSKYLINGKTAEPARVQNLFHSVQLNVNNPHFLIMQGRITKVLNMKPPEILGLLEEAAGTKMYESKKQAALRTLEKKQVKVDEISRVLAEDIMPALDKLRKEKVQYMEWQNATASLDRLRRFCVAHQYAEAAALRGAGEADVARAAAGVAELEAAGAALEAELRERDDEVAGLQTEKELQSGGEAKELAEAVDEIAKRLVKDTSAWANKKEALEGERASVAALAGQLEALDEAGLAARVAAAREAQAAAQAELDAAVAGVDAAAAELAGAEAGDGRDASNRSAAERLADARNAQTEAEAEAKAAEARVKHVGKQLAERRKALASKEKEGSKLAAEVERERAAAASCRARLAAGGFNAAAAEAGEAAVEAARAAAAAARDRAAELSSRLAALDFAFKDPERGFDRARVKGVVAKLVRVRDPAAATALEVAAGGKLYQVVVDTAETAAALLARGQLRSRVTIIPLNKVSGRAVAPSAAAAAKAAAGDKAAVALELVGYDAELAAAATYAFGNAFVCKDAGTAKKLAFMREVATRCITLEGDDFNPGGTLTGGSRAKGASVLARLHELAEAEAEAEAEATALAAAEAAVGAGAAAAKAHRAAAQELELKEHALALLEERLAGSEAAQLASAAAAAEAELAEATAAVGAARERKAALGAAAKELEREIANFGKEKDSHVKAAKEKLKGAKARVEACRKAVKAAAAAVQGAEAEAEAAEGERGALAEQRVAAEAAAAELDAAVAALGGVVAAAKAEYDERAARLEELRARLRECDAEIAAAATARAALEARRTEAVVERKRLALRLESLRKGIADAADRVAGLEREYPWIPSEAPQFGRPGGDYDWAANDPTAAFAEFERAGATIEALARKVNRKVMQMFEKAEQEYTELKRKKDVVEADKSKIEEVMEELDEKKRAALETTWRKVDADFGSIFSTLLPGTTAKLEPEEGTSFLDGLEVRVAFGGVWKESLTELSGGQKSLLALSLILAMLLFKPAPIYILDEVDAALDLSHTQNIGRMIKAHFPQSQFIVVSLKEGMFQNANVIFRTKFVDGVSTVTRSVNERRPEEDAGGGKAAARPRAALTENVRA